MLLMHILAKLRSSAFVNKHSRWKLFAFNGQKSGPTKPILLLKESEQIALIIKAHAENAVMLIFLSRNCYNVTLDMED